MKVAAATEAVSAHAKLLRLTRKRLEKYAALLPKLLISDAPETVHNLRVWGRRLQQALRVVAQASNAKKVKKLVGDLRHVRQTLGPCRDLDVNIALVKSKRDHGANASVQKAWACMQSELESQRQAMIERLRRDLAGQELFKFIATVQSLISALERDFDPVDQIALAMAKSMDGWEKSLAATREQPDAGTLHALRLAGKKLRYRAELLSDLGQASVKPLVKSLKEIQTALGDWHDRSVLLHHIAEFIGRPSFLVDHPDIGRILLAEMEKERLRNDSDFSGVRQHAGEVQQAWAAWRASASAQ